MKGAGVCSAGRNFSNNGLVVMAAMDAVDAVDAGRNGVATDDEDERQEHRVPSRLES